MERYYSSLIFALIFSASFFGCDQKQKESKNTIKLTDEQLMDTVQKQTFKYFWDFADPHSGMAKERNTEAWVTSGGSGFGVMSIIVGIERNFITREQGLERLIKIVGFLETCDRFHGAWPHWLFGKTGKTKAFSKFDNGGDLVETAYLIQGLLTVQGYFSEENERETELRSRIQTLWEEVEWDWYRKNGENKLYWHWSEEYGWKMNMPVRGWNECLITYVLASASPTHGVPPIVYHEGWTTSNHFFNGKEFEGLPLALGFDYGGPLFFAHYSFLGLNPNGLKDQYAIYFELNRNHSLINYRYCMRNPKNFKGYAGDAWGLTASDDPFVGYMAHGPGERDNGTISPTAAISSVIYTPEESLKAMHYYYQDLGDSLWGKFGFKDAYNLEVDWFANTYLAIDQGPIMLMIENYRTGLLWKCFMKNEDVQNGLDNLGFDYKIP